MTEHERAVISVIFRRDSRTFIVHKTIYNVNRMPIQYIRSESMDATLDEVMDLSAVHDGNNDFRKLAELDHYRKINPTDKNVPLITFKLKP